MLPAGQNVAVRYRPIERRSRTGFPGGPRGLAPLTPSLGGGRDRRTCGCTGQGQCRNGCRSWGARGPRGQRRHGPPGRTETRNLRAANPDGQRAPRPRAVLNRHRQGPPFRYGPGEPVAPPTRPGCLRPYGSTSWAVDAPMEIPGPGSGRANDGRLSPGAWHPPRARAIWGAGAPSAGAPARAE